MTPIDDLRNSVLQKYGQEGLTFLDIYNADFIFRKQINVDECYFGDYPTLAQLNKGYDKKFPVVWLMTHLHNLSEYCGCKDKLSGTALSQCAIVIATEYYFLKTTELILFFHRFKSGKYGGFYGSVDPLIITKSLRDFLKERSFAYEIHEREEQRRKDEESRKDAVSWEEYREKFFPRDGVHPFERSYMQHPPFKSEEDTENIKSVARNILEDPIAESKEFFIKAFLKKYGCTPQDYIETHK